MDELFNAYNQTGLLSMVLQEFIQWEDYGALYVPGAERRSRDEYNRTTATTILNRISRRNCSSAFTTTR